MPNNFFITGLPKIGKTTLLRQLAHELKSRGFKVGGFLSPDIGERGTREGFYVEDIVTRRRALLAEVSSGGSPRVGKYRVDVPGFESIALPCMERSSQYDILIIDEIGTMEMESERFCDALADLLQTPVPVVASLHGTQVPTYQIYGTVYALTESNRGQVYRDILSQLTGILRKKPAKKLAFEKVDHAVKQKEKKTSIVKPKPSKRPSKPKKMPAVSKITKKPKRAPAMGKAKPVAAEQRPAGHRVEKKPAEKRKKGLFDRLDAWLRGS